MTELFVPGAGLLFMKVGVHAQETLEDIIRRKSEEIEKEGFAMWGYGGNTCHPRSMVQPFAQAFEERGQPIHLIMEEMDSKHFAEPLRAKQFSPDGTTWIDIPENINVLGSRYALVINSLDTIAETISLDQTRVPVGPSTGRLGSRYIKGRVDKACLEVLTKAELVNDEPGRTIDVQLAAKLHEPYAVFLRS